MELKAIREKRAELAKQIKSLADVCNAENRDHNSEEKERWEKINTEYDLLTRNLEKCQRAEDVEKALAGTISQASGIGREDCVVKVKSNSDKTSDEQTRSLAFQGWARVQADLPMSEEQEEACERAGVRPYSNSFGLKLHDSDRFKEFRDMESSGTGAEFIPQGFVNKVEKTLLAFGNMFGLANVLRTDSGNALLIPTSDDTGNTGALLAESTTIGSSVDPTLSQAQFDAYKYSSKPIIVSNELLEDSAINLVDYISSALGERLGRILGSHLTTGDGTNKPKGVAAASTLGVSAASATAITADELINLAHSVDPAYRGESNVGFMMKDSTVQHIRKLKDGNGQYLWSPGLSVGVPDRFLGYPVYVNQAMEAVATGKKSVLFGPFSRYIIRQVRDIRFVRMNERYADTDQVGFVAFMRVDGDLPTTAAIKHILQA